jgi:hypothetical protein
MGEPWTGLTGQFQDLQDSIGCSLLEFIYKVDTCPRRI